ncbi:MAG TPA: N-acetyltransferase [Candidatus Bathyarchaeia archaeon]|nr:N-acetyltransferase [Candidatus Bathyarchaeia archaeon]
MGEEPGSPPSASRLVAEIRPEVPPDYPSVRAVNLRAFGRSAEARLVDLLRQRGHAVVSLVAVVAGQVVGHIIFSPVTLDPAENIRAVGLGPMAVLPEHHNRGIGSQLVVEGLRACRDAAQDLVVVLGHRGYYPRFGFSRARDHGLESEYDAPNALMVLELTPGTLVKVSGVARYPSEFREMGC